MPMPSYASVALHYGFCSWLLHLQFEDKRSWLICLLHVSVASGPGLAEPACWNAFSFIPSTAAKSLLNKKTDGVKVRGLSQRRKCLVTCISLLERSVSETLLQKWLCILHLNIIIHGQSLLAVGTDCSFRIFKVRASLLFLWHSCLHWITVENIFLAYLSAFAGVSFMNPDSSQCRAPTCSTLVCVFGAWYEISIWCKRECAHASSHIFMYIQYHEMGSTDNCYALIGDRSFAWVQARRPTQL